MSAWGWGEGWDSADEPSVLAEVCSGEPGPIPALGPKPFYLHPCYLWSPGVSSEFIVKKYGIGFLVNTASLTDSGIGSPMFISSNEMKKE